MKEKLQSHVKKKKKAGPTPFVCFFLKHFDSSFKLVALTKLAVATLLC